MAFKLEGCHKVQELVSNTFKCFLNYLLKPFDRSIQIHPNDIYHLATFRFCWYIIFRWDKTDLNF